MILVFFIIGIVLSVFLNLSVILFFCCQKNKLNVLELSLVSLALSDLLQAGIGFSMEILSFFKKNENNEKSCIIGGFLVGSLSLVSMLSLVTISLERYVVLKYPFQTRDLFQNQKIAIIVIIFTWILAILYSLPPLVGWSSYRRLRDDDFVCQLDMVTGEKNSTSYLWFLLVSCYIAPMIVISVCSVSIIQEITKIKGKQSTF